MIEVETPQEIEVVSNSIDVEARSLDVEVVDLKELDITVAKKEFVITGDDIYVPKLYDDAPQWMKDLVQLVVNSAMDTGNASTLAQLASMLSQFATSYVPLNQYTQSILDLSNEDASIHAVIETLNSNYNNGLSQANAQILSLQNTKASKDEVVAQVVSTLAAQLADPTSSLGAAISSLQQTVVNNQNANALSMQTLTASLGDVSGQVSSNATVVNNALAYVGIDSAGASTGTGLSAYVQGSNGQFGSAGSGINNQISVAATGVESKWAYNSSLTINGTNYNSGFGLSNSAGTGAGSEFWINADKLKFTNNGKTGSKAPFTIDASGVVPEITFNGKVAFANVTGYTPPDVNGSISSNNDAFAQAQGFASYADMASKYSTLGKTIISGGYINTGLVTTNSMIANSIQADRLSAGTTSSTVWTGGGLISQNFNGNPYGNIGNPTSGFRLSSNAAGTATDPNMYGAYIKGSTIDTSALAISSLKVLTSYGTTGSLMFTSVRSFVGYTTDQVSVLDTVYSPSYGSGYTKNRLCTFTTPIILDGTIFIDIDVVTLSIDVSYDGGAWSTLTSASQSGNGNTGLAISHVFTPAASGWGYLNIRFHASGNTSRSGVYKYLVINGA